jgi:hypothetical protein
VNESHLEADIAIVGASLGGVAAALAACEAGYRVVMSEAHPWIGGQVTSQGVAALDEHPLIELFGATRRYAAFRQQVRAYYQTHYGAPDTMPDGTPLNPGNGWVSRLCFEPRVGLDVLQAMLAPHRQAGRLMVLTGYRPRAATMCDERIATVTLQGFYDQQVRLHASYVLDATDLGELLPLSGTEYVSGAEAQSDTGEPHAVPVAQPDRVQSFTYSFAVEYRPGEYHTIAKPASYERFRVLQPYSLTLGDKHFRMFVPGPNGELPFWSYRRLYDAALLGDDESNDIALINWASNDYRQANLIDQDPLTQRRILQEAKQLALGFLYWLQTECPRDEGGYGYPELRLRPDVLGSNDGLSQVPYIRESRRLVALERVCEQDIITQPDGSARARPFSNSVGIGWYPLDLHACVGDDAPEAFTFFDPTLPFQIPLGALIPIRTRNLLAACKNIGTTHLTNGAYRVHHVEWAIGEAAGALAAFCLQHGVTPHQVHSHSQLVRRFQDALLAQGIPLAWTVDVPLEHPLFAVVQRLYLSGLVTPSSPRYRRLEVTLDAPVHPDERQELHVLGEHNAEIYERATSWLELCELYSARS